MHYRLNSSNEMTLQFYFFSRTNETKIESILDFLKQKAVMCRNLVLIFQLCFDNIFFGHLK